MPRRPPISTLFPYTTLFRSQRIKRRAKRDERTLRILPELFQRHAVALLARLAEVGLVLGMDLVEEIENDHPHEDRKSTRLNSSHPSISYAVFCLKKKKKKK